MSINFKKVVLFATILTLAFSASAQRRDKYDARSTGRVADDTIITNSVGWVRYHLLDEWSIMTQMGGQLYYGFDDRQGPLYDRLTGDAGIYIQRWVFPMFGYRLGASAGSCRGFLRKDIYDECASSIVNDDHNGIGGQSGINPITGNPYGGYYWDYNNELLIQKWNYNAFSFDLLLNTDIFKGAERFNPNKRFNNIIYGGVASRWAHNELSGFKNHKSEYHVGYIAKYSFTQRWSIFADVRASFMERTFDREWVGGYEPPTGFGVHGDWVVNAQVGLNYHFNFRSDEARRRFYNMDNFDDHDITNAEGPRHVHYVMVEEVQQVRIVDSILHYQNDSVPTPRTRRIIDSLQGELDDLINNGKRGAWEQPLDSILLNRLLPYEMVFFELDKWDILPSEEMKIAKMAYIMKTYPKEKFILTGSADSQTGTVKRNIFLSHNRADVVYNKLISEYDIDPDQLDREYLGGILDYDPFQLNRATVIIMDHPAVRKAFNDMKSKREAGGGSVEVD